VINTGTVGTVTMMNGMILTKVTNTEVPVAVLIILVILTVIYAHVGYALCAVPTYCMMTCLLWTSMYGVRAAGEATAIRYIA